MDHEHRALRRQRNAEHHQRGCRQRRDSSVIAQSGAVVVDGRGSTFADRDPAGFFCDGTLKISNGGATTSGFACIGNGGGSTGTVTVDGAGSTWTEPLLSSYLFGNIYVGYQGNGSLNITNGGAVSAGGTTYVGWRPAARAQSTSAPTVGR